MSFPHTPKARPTDQQPLRFHAESIVSQRLSDEISPRAPTDPLRIQNHYPAIKETLNLICQNSSVTNSPSKRLQIRLIMSPTIMILVGDIISTMFLKAY
jgi:hypothetical protein